MNVANSQIGSLKRAQAKRSQFPVPMASSSAAWRLGVSTCCLGAMVTTAAWLLPARFAGAEDRPALEQLTKIGDEFPREIRPVLQTYCLKCHSTDKKKGELDLERFTSPADVRQGTRVWQKVAEMLDEGEMPPKDAKQPPADVRRTLRGWVRRYLDAEARANAGDPGRVVLRRLSNAEYTHTIRDLTGVTTLEPAREFPVDGAAGEGFTNTGSALVMSPALLSKYLDAAKGVASHAVLLEDGIRFSSRATRRDWTDEIVAEIRQFYRRYSDPSGATRVNLQGIVSDTNEGGRLPLAKYLAATVDERDALASGKKTIAAVAVERGLNGKYLGRLWSMLTGKEPSLLFDPLRVRWRQAKPADVAGLAADVGRWQQALWKFNSVGHIGRTGGPKAWQEPVSPLTAKQELRLKLPSSPDGKEVVIYLAVHDAGDGNEHDFVVWERPRLVAPGRTDLLLRDVRDVSCELANRRERLFGSAAKCLAAADEAIAAHGSAHVADLARRHRVESELLAAWLDYLGIGTGGAVKIDSLFEKKFDKASGYDFITGWGSSETPIAIANSSDRHVRIPGNMKPHSVAVHPSPTLQVAVGWRSPVAATLRVEANVTHAHPECGNGVTWSLELRRRATRTRLASGIAQGPAEVKVPPIEKQSVQPGDVISLIVGPRDGNHSCDLTGVDLKITSSGKGGRHWNLAQDVSGNILSANPHPDRFGTEGVWNFYTEPVQGAAVGPVIPAGSVLAKWRSAERAEDRRQLAEAVQQLLASGPPQAKENPDAVLYRQLASLGGPLLGAARRPVDAKPGQTRPSLAPSASGAAWGLDPMVFGRHPNGSAIDPASLCVQAPTALEVRLPANLVEGCELVTTALLHRDTGRDGSAQIAVSAAKPSPAATLQSGVPILVNEGSAARDRMEASLESFRELFPAALCYARIVPVDEVVTLTLFHREDDHLRRLMLDEEQAAQLDRMWSDLHFASQDALTLVDAYLQLMEYATQDRPDLVVSLESLRKPIHDRATAFRQAMVAAEPRQLDAALAFAERAYRRPLTADETVELRSLYSKLRRQELPHDEAIRLTLARILVAPAFLYKLEEPGPAADAVPVSDWELATRLSYFLWSSLPDDELRAVAATGRLRDPAVLAAQTRRMLGDARVRRLATEFACQWLHIYDFAALDEKSERHFPTFVALRGAMYEESIQFFTDLFQRNGSAWEILDADHTFLNEALAKHYGIPGVTGDEWRRVDGVKKYDRGGILGLSTTLAKQSGASRTSPILRGNWISEVLLGEKLPRPPKGVPQLPEDETATAGLTVRQLVEKHDSDPKCAVCHRRIDAYGFALEGYDAIGRRRNKDLAGRTIDTHATAMDGAKFEDLGGLRGYLLTVRREAFVRQLCRKLLGYALGRAVQLSDEPLLAEMQRTLSSADGRLGTVIEQIVRSRQFREIRGRDAAFEDGQSN